MSTLTQKLGLTKPDPTDNVDVAILSNNFQILDDAFAGISPAFRNIIRNGDMSVAQRGDGPWSTSGVYTIDGWILFGSGGTFTMTRPLTTLGSGSGINGAKRALQVVTTGQSAVGDNTLVAHRIEGVETLAGKVVTLSFLAAGGAGNKIGVEITQNFGTGGSPSAQVNTAIQAITISAIWTSYTVTFTVPSVAGKTLGTSGDYLMLNLWLSAGSTNASRASNIGIQNATIAFTDVQLELGAVATAFERLPYQAQLSWCQRFFTRLGGRIANEVIGFGIVVAGTTTLIWVLLPVPLRAVAGPVVTGVGGFQLSDGTVTPATTLIQNNISVGAGGVSGSLDAQSGAGGMTIGRACRLLSTVTTSFVDYSAEL